MTNYNHHYGERPEWVDSGLSRPPPNLQPANLQCCRELTDSVEADATGAIIIETTNNFYGRILYADDRFTTYW